MSSFNNQQFQPLSSVAGFTSITPMTTLQSPPDDAFPLCPLDDWLDPAAVDLFNKDILNFLPISPPLTVSSTLSSPPNLQQQQQQQDVNDAFISLFPEIMNTNVPPPRPVQTSTTARRLAPRPVAIMPKTAADSASAGATYHLKRPLSSVDTSENKDDIAQKRQKNTDAARRSRLKKVVKMENLEKRVSELEGDNARLTTRVAVLESEKTSLIAKDKGLEDRIKVLEAQLAEAHKALTCKMTCEKKSD